MRPRHNAEADRAGHYVAQVYDPAQDQWFRCDDETCEANNDIGSVAAANAINLDSDDDQSTDKHGGSPSPKSPPKCVGPGIAPIDQRRIKSKDAYMLVYTRRPAT